MPAGQPLSVLKITVNGKIMSVANPSPSMLLVDFIRDICGLTGTKIACGEGGCGACTVSARAPDSAVPVAINSCLRLLCACDGWEITTVEGYGSQADGFSAVQKAIADGSGSQCGFCTPGWVVAMSTLLESNPTPSRREVEDHFDGHICRKTSKLDCPSLSSLSSPPPPPPQLSTSRTQDRCLTLASVFSRTGCTGYRPILEAFKDLACGDEDQPQAEVEFTCRKDLGQCGDIEDIAGKPARASGGCKQERAGGKVRHGGLLRFVDDATGDEYLQPSDLRTLVRALEMGAAARNKAVHVVASNTGMGVVKYFRPEEIGQPPEGNMIFVDLSNVSELKTIAPEEGAPSVASEPSSLAVGAAVCIEELMTSLTSYFAPPDSEEGDPESSAGVYKMVVRHLSRIANVEVRNIASWAGNVALCAKNPAFPSDMVLVLAAIGVEVDVLVGVRTRRVSIEEYLRLVRRRSDEDKEELILLRGYFPKRPAKSYFFYSDKTSQRHVNAHAIVNLAALLTIDGATILNARVVAGGLGDSDPQRLGFVEKAISGRRIDEDETLQSALSALDRTFLIRPLSADPQNSRKYRMALARAFVFKTFLCAQETTSGVASLPYDLLSATM
jgi:xanthine dehydrogenase/oxidase